MSAQNMFKGQDPQKVKSHHISFDHLQKNTHFFLDFTIFFGGGGGGTLGFRYCNNGSTGYYSINPTLLINAFDRRLRPFQKRML